ncbi:MAG: M48 family metalloprotease [Symploca sp. SIO2B6]|nr:M48 family metalloprotease [Symploca sp. SIO2B6]
MLSLQFIYNQSINFLKTVVLLSLLSGLLTLIGYLLMRGVIGALFGLVIAIIINFGTWFYSDKIVLRVYNARTPDSREKARLQPIIEVLSSRAKLPIPKLYIIPTSIPNAFATGRSPKHGIVGVTEGLMRLLPDDELEGVIAHELTHIKNRDTLTQTIASTLAGAISLLAQIGVDMMFRGLFSSRNSGWRFVTLLPTLFLAPITATIIQLAISRTREYSADAGAAALTGNPRALANALGRLQNNRSVRINVNAAFQPLLIINPFKKELATRLFSTHPPTEARIQKLLKLELQLRSNPNSY